MKAPSVIKTNEVLKVSAEVQNTGKMDGDEVVELYVKLLDAKVPVPTYSLQGFKRIFLKSGEKRIVEFDLKPEQFSLVDDENKRVVEPGRMQLSIGGCLPSQKALESENVLHTEVKISGEVNVIE